MKRTSIIKASVRHRRKEPTAPVVRFSSQEKNKIRRLAKLRGTSASKSVMELVEGALKSKKPASMQKNSMGPKRRLTGSELMALPPQVRQRRFEAQAEKAAIYYHTDPDLNFQIDEDIASY